MWGHFILSNKFTGNYLTVSTLEQVMHRAVSEAELPAGATPHSLRHPYVKHTTKNIFLQKQKSQAINRF